MSEKIETVFCKSKICVTCDRKIIDGTDQEEIIRHYELGHEVITDNRTSQEYADDVKKRLNSEGDESHLQNAKIVLNRVSIKTLEDTKEILYYENGVYLPNGENKIKKELFEIDPNLQIHDNNEIIEKIKQMTYTPRIDFDNDEFEVCVRNGIINVKTGQFTEHDPHKLFRVQIPVSFNPKAQSRKFVQFLRQSLPLPDDYINQFEAFSTGLIKNSPKLEALFFETGTGDNGKSTLFKIMNWFYGRENYSTVSIHELILNRFAKARLEGKLLNTFPDIESDALDNFGLVKALVSGDEIDAESKYQHPHSFVNYAKLFFSANELPEIREKTFATFKRIRLTQWTQTFVKPTFYSQLRADLGQKFPEFTEQELESELALGGKHVMNKQFIDDILADENEKSGILNLLLITIRHLIKRDGFFNEYSIEEIKDDWSQNSTAIESFVNECLVKDPTAFLVKSEIYAVYYNYCKAIGKPPKGDNVLHPTIKSLIPGLEEGKKRVKKGQVERRVYLGLKWNKDHNIVRKFIGSFATEAGEAGYPGNYVDDKINSSNNIERFYEKPASPDSDNIEEIS